MRKVSARIRYVLFGFCMVLVLGACIKPVGINSFLNNEIVDEIARGSTGGNIDIDYEHPENLAPVLLADVAGLTPAVAEDGTVTVSQSNLNNATITVTNADSYDNIIEWHYNKAPVENGDTLIVGSIIDFNAVGIYPVTVIGEKSGVYYSTLFYIKVES